MRGLDLKALIISALLTLFSSLLFFELRRIDEIRNFIENEARDLRGSLSSISTLLKNIKDLEKAIKEENLNVYSLNEAEKLIVSKLEELRRKYKDVKLLGNITRNNKEIIARLEIKVKVEVSEDLKDVIRFLITSKEPIFFIENAVINRKSRELRIILTMKQPYTESLQ